MLGYVAKIVERGNLNLYDSLHGVLADEDEGITEALRRNAELEENLTQTISLEELDEQIKSERD